MLQPDAVSAYLWAMRDRLSALAKHPRAWEARYAAAIADRCCKDAPASRASLLAVLEASLGVADLDLAVIHAELEDELSVGAPTEFEHYQQFRLRTQMEEIDQYVNWRSQVVSKPDWQVLHDNGFGITAVSITRACVLSTVTPSSSPRILLAMTQYAYTELGLGQAAFSAVKLAKGDVDDLARLQNTPLQRLPKLKELFKRQQSQEEQLLFWEEPGNDLLRLSL